MLEHGKSALVAATIVSVMGFQGPSATPAGTRYQEHFEVLRGGATQGGKCTPIEAPSGHRLVIEHVSMDVYAPAADRSPNAFLVVSIYRASAGGDVYLRPELIDRDLGELGGHVWSGRWQGPLTVAPSDTGLRLCATDTAQTVRAVVVGTLEPL